MQGDEPYSSWQPLHVHDSMTHCNAFLHPTSGAYSSIANALQQAIEDAGTGQSDQEDAQGSSKKREQVHDVLKPNLLATTCMHQPAMLYA